MHGAFIAARGLSLVAVSGLLTAMPSLVVVASLAEQGLQAHGLQELWRVGLVAMLLVGSSWTRD